MNLTEALVSLLAPHICFSCGIEGMPLCTVCTQTQIAPTEINCYKCGSLGYASNPCPACKVISPLSSAYIVTDYTSTSKQLIASLKFNRAKAAADVVARLMDLHLPTFSPNLLISAVPTANKRVRTRGYDQAQLIAKKLAIRRKHKYIDSLYRIGSTRQVGADRINREIQLKGAYKIKNQNKVRGKHILIVDDVMTTGYTLEAAARTLLSAGAAKVEAATFAYSRPKIKNSSSTRSDAVSRQ